MQGGPSEPVTTGDRDRVLGRYALHGELASGGMATVYLGSLVDPLGFSRIVAIKRLHPQFAKDPEFGSMFLDEARLVARIRHPNVVPTLDVVSTDGELFLVMEYVEGESLSGLLRLISARKEQTPLRIVSALLVGVLHGLHAAHEARDVGGLSLQLVHRDVSPQNILVGRDGVARLLDFGIAKALGRAQSTQDGRIKGKLGYMSPEQLLGRALTRRSDIFAAGIVLWEFAAQERLFSGDSQEEIACQVLVRELPPLTVHRPAAPDALLKVIERALARTAEDRFATAREMADELEACVAPATVAEVSRWVEEVAGASIAERAERVARTEARRSGRALATGSTAPTVPDLDRVSTKEGVWAQAGGRESQASSGSMGGAVSMRTRPLRLVGAQAALVILGSVVLATAAVVVWNWRPSGPTAHSSAATATPSALVASAGPDPSATVEARGHEAPLPSSNRGAVPDAAPSLSTTSRATAPAPTAHPRKTPSSPSGKAVRAPDVLDDRE